MLRQTSNAGACAGFEIKEIDQTVSSLQLIAALAGAKEHIRRNHHPEPPVFIRLALLQGHDSGSQGNKSVAGFDRLIDLVTGDPSYHE